MQPISPLLASFRALALLAGATLLAFASGPGTPAPAARLVRASIAVDGQVVLCASTSDDGRPDADQVWSYLLERLEFQPTDAFPSLGIDPAAESATIGWLEDGETGARGARPEIVLDVVYGGRDAPFVLGLVRSAGQDAWRVDRATVEGRFAHRRITRAEAALLLEPKRKN